MASFIPFKAYRPDSNIASELASHPYDVVDDSECRALIEHNPKSFLRVVRSESEMDGGTNPYDPSVYARARQNLESFIGKGYLARDNAPCYYMYAQSIGTHTQYGLVGLASVKDYEQDIIKKHEKTRKQKEADRTQHIDTLSTHTGPVFLTYKPDEEIKNILKAVPGSCPLIFDFKSFNDITHKGWILTDSDLIDRLHHLLAKIPAFYIADGHHRAASAVSVAKKRLEQDSSSNAGHFLAILFPAEQLKILPYNRVVKDLNGHSVHTFLEAVSNCFDVTDVSSASEAVPVQPATFSLYLDKQWYTLKLKPQFMVTGDPVASLDVSYLQNLILEPILGIADPRSSDRIDFVGGIRGTQELEKRVNSGEMRLAFSMYPTLINDLIDVADAGLLMPPKSTWFEPKLLSGLFVNRF